MYLNKASIQHTHVIYLNSNNPTLLMDVVQVVTRTCMTRSLIQALLQVLQSLPESLAVAVLAAAQVDLAHQLFVLPVSLHSLAIEAAYPSIRRDHSFTLDFSALCNVPE
jgi:hypothetical protein